jgi:hypothetical protein
LLLSVSRNWFVQIPPATQRPIAAPSFWKRNGRERRMVRFGLVTCPLRVTGGRDGDDAGGEGDE